VAKRGGTEVSHGSGRQPGVQRDCTATGTIPACCWRLAATCSSSASVCSRARRSPWLVRLDGRSDTHCRPPLFRASLGRGHRRGTGAAGRRMGKEGNHGRAASRTTVRNRVRCATLLHTRRRGAAPACRSPLPVAMLRIRDGARVAWIAIATLAGAGDAAARAVPCIYGRGLLLRR
jgi:hypothetical protein